MTLGIASFTRCVLPQRSCVFKWIGAVAIELGNDLPTYLTQLLAPLYREESDSTNTAGSTH